MGTSQFQCPKSPNLPTFVWIGASGVYHRNPHVNALHFYWHHWERAHQWFGDLSGEGHSIWSDILCLGTPVILKGCCRIIITLSSEGPLYTRGKTDRIPLVWGDAQGCIWPSLWLELANIAGHPVCSIIGALCSFPPGLMVWVALCKYACSALCPHNCNRSSASPASQLE